MQDAIASGRKWLPTLTLVLLTALLGLSCSDDNGTNPQPNPVPDFTLEDINPNSPTYQQDVTLSDYDGHIVMIYTGEEDCSNCKAQFQLMEQAADSVATEGIFNVTPIMINQHGPNGVDPATAALYVGAWDVTAPILHDTYDAANGWDTVGHLIDLESFNDFMITDRSQVRWRKTSVGHEKALDLLDPDDFATLLSWIRQIHQGK